MPVYTLNPSNRRAAKRKASHSPSLRERVSLRRNSAQSADGSEMYYPTSSTSSSSTQRSRAASSATSAVANAQARRYAAEASGYMGNPRAKTPTRKDEIQRLAHEAGYHVETYSPGDGVTRYRFFDLAEMDRKGVSMREMSYFGPLNGVDTVLGLAAAKKWLSKSRTRRHNPLSEDGAVVSNPRRKGAAKRSGGRTAAQGNAAKAMKLYHSGQASSLAEAWQMVRGSSARRNPLSEDGAVVSNPRRKGGAKPSAKRSGGRTAAQSNAARAMKLFHSGKASSLAEAWDIIRSGR